MPIFMHLLSVKLISLMTFMLLGRLHVLVQQSDMTSGLILSFHLGLGQRSVMTMKSTVVGFIFPETCLCPGMFVCLLRIVYVTGLGLLHLADAYLHGIGIEICGSLCLSSLEYGSNLYVGQQFKWTSDCLSAPELKR